MFVFEANDRSAFACHMFHVCFPSGASLWVNRAKNQFIIYLVLLFAIELDSLVGSVTDQAWMYSHKQTST